MPALLPFAIIFLTLSTANSRELPFSRELLDDKIEIGYGLAIGDVDGDGKKDILLADKNEFVWYRNPGWEKHVLTTNKRLNGRLGPKMRDNVCLAARDLDGDGKVEIAVGSQWNPGETSDEKISGSVHFLLRPEDPTKLWGAVPLPHEPTTHRMRWVKIPTGKYQLVVLPLHGRGNKKGEGAGVKVLGYEYPENPTSGKWLTETISDSLHMTHNFDVMETEKHVTVAIASKEGLYYFDHSGQGWEKSSNHYSKPAGEVDSGAFISPMHGNEVCVLGDQRNHHVLDDTLNQGHAIAIADVLESVGSREVIAGWRTPDKDGKTGIKIYTKEGEAWNTHVLDHEIATEDLKVADIDDDGDLDIIAAGRASKNVVLYRNTTK